MVAADCNLLDTTEFVMRIVHLMFSMIMELKDVLTRAAIILTFFHYHIQETGPFVLNVKIMKIIQMVY